MSIQEQIKYVVDNSNFVSIDYKKVEEFANELGEVNYHHWYEDLSLNLDEKQRIIMAFIIESLNFCFWQKPKFKTIYKGETLKGSEALFYSIIKEVEQNKDFLNVDNLILISKNEFKNIFRGVDSEIPLLNERYDIFKDTIEVINNKGEKFYEELFRIDNDIDLLNYIVSNFKYFDDSSSYKDIKISFNKRATLLTNDLFYMSETIRKNVGNVNDLTGCADYGIPRTLRTYEILQYNDELSNIVDNELELKHDSEMEIEIRANMLYVLELIKDILKSKGIIINSVELDNLIWEMGRKKKNTKPYHHTITIFY